MFTLNNDYSIQCEFKDKKEGFSHIAKLWKKGRILCSVKENYINRTWERFEFETVLKKCIKAYFNEPLASEFLKLVDNAISY